MSNYVSIHTDMTWLLAECTGAERRLILMAHTRDMGESMVLFTR